jgi:hypothetical protein
MEYYANYTNIFLSICRINMKMARLNFYLIKFTLPLLFGAVTLSGCFKPEVARIPKPSVSSEQDHEPAENSFSVAGEGSISSGSHENEEKSIVEELAQAMEKLPPVTRHNLENEIYSFPIDILLICEDDTGCTDIAYSVNGPIPDFNGSGTRISSSQLSIRLGEAGDGVYTIQFRGRDIWGNIEATQSLTVTIDSTPPLISSNLSSGTYYFLPTLTLTCSDATTNCVHILYTTDGSDPSADGTAVAESQPPAEIHLSIGGHTIKFTAKDDAGNRSEIQTLNFMVSLPCQQKMISDSGFEPCMRECGNQAYEKAKAN